MFKGVKETQVNYNNGKFDLLNKKMYQYILIYL
jgi:hypothetical protein